MIEWLEIAFVVVIALGGIFIGRFFSKRRNPSWLWGYFISVVFIGILIAPRFSNYFIFGQPFSWLLAGRLRFVFFAFAVTIGLTSPLGRLPGKRQKVLTCISMAFFVIVFSVLPFLLPALMKQKLLNLPTIYDSDGICLQSTDYTCAPAAAVTALNRLGIQADEGQLAVLSHTSPIIGTLPSCLSDALRNRYNTEGLECRYRYFDSVDQLREADITLAAVKDSFFSDHCIAIIGVSENKVFFADPAFGKVSMDRGDFEKIWRFCGITLKRKSSANI